MIRRAIPLFHVSNAAAAVEFYCRGLGFQLQFQHRPEGVTGDPCYMGITRDGVWLHLSSFNGDGIPGGVANLMVNDVDEMFAEFHARQVPIDMEPVTQSWGSREMYVKDADRNCLRFIGRP